MNKGAARPAPYRYSVRRRTYHGGISTKRFTDARFTLEGNAVSFSCAKKKYHRPFQHCVLQSAKMSKASKIDSICFNRQISASSISPGSSFHSEENTFVEAIVCRISRVNRSQYPCDSPMSFCSMALELWPKPRSSSRFHCRWHPLPSQRRSTSRRPAR